MNKSSYRNSDIFHFSSMAVAVAVLLSAIATGCSPSVQPSLNEQEQNGSGSVDEIGGQDIGDGGDGEEPGQGSADELDLSKLDFTAPIIDFSVFGGTTPPSPDQSNTPTEEVSPVVTRLTLEIKIKTIEPTQNREIKLYHCDSSVPRVNLNPNWLDPVHCGVITLPVQPILNGALIRLQAAGLSLAPAQFHFQRLSLKAQSTNARVTRFNAELTFVRIQTTLGNNLATREIYFDPCIKRALTVDNSTPHATPSAYLMSRNDSAMCVHAHTLTAAEEEGFDRRLGLTHDLVNFSQDPTNNSIFNWLGRGSHDPVKIVFPDTNYGSGASFMALGSNWTPDTDYRFGSHWFNWSQLPNAGEFNRLHLEQTSNDSGFYNHLYFDNLVAYHYQPGSDAFTLDPLHRACNQVAQRLVYLENSGRFPHRDSEELNLRHSSLPSANAQAFCNTLGIN